jgi:hypothetical protein
MVADAGPLVDDEHAGTLARHGVVIRLPAFAQDVAGLVFEGLFHDGRGEGADDGEEGGQEGFHAGETRQAGRRRKCLPT